MVEDRLAIVCATQSYPGETVNGDAWAVHWHEGACRISLVDGLGHGPDAAATAIRAIAALADRPELGPVEAIHMCHAALGGTRGAAVSIARIEPNGLQLIFAGIGNVEARLRISGRDQQPVPYRGIVGYSMRTVRSLTFDLPAHWLLALFTDGINARWEFSKTVVESGLQSFADGVLLGFGSANDDATIVVAESGRKN